MTDNNQLDRAARLLRWMKLAMQAVLIIGMSWAIWRGEIFEAILVFVLTMISFSPIYFSRRYAIVLPPEFEILAIVFLYCTLFLGEFGDFYNRFWWWDAVLHTSSGFLLGLVAFLLVFTLNKNPRADLALSPFFISLFAFTFAVACGAVWEIYEYTMDSLIGTNMQKSGLVDTMWDLIVDSIGAFAMSFLGYGYLKDGRKSFVVDWAIKFLEKNPRFFKDKNNAGPN